MSDAEVYQLGIQMVRQLEVVHKAGYVHADIKPENILIGQEPGSTDRTMRARLIDFGVSQSYKNEDGTHIEHKEINKFMGNPEFATINQMKFNSVSRRDDLQSLCYLLFYLVGAFPLVDK